MDCEDGGDCKDSKDGEGGKTWRKWAEVRRADAELDPPVFRKYRMNRFVQLSHGGVHSLHGLSATPYCLCVEWNRDERLLR